MRLGNRKRAGMAVAVIGLVGILSVRTTKAEEPVKPQENPKAEASKAEPSKAEIAQWVKDLDSDAFATRQAAGDMLFQTGKPAIAALADAALGKSLEATMQAVNVLRRLTQTGDKEAREAAKDALERLAMTETAAAAPARQALAPPPKPAATPNAPGVIPGIGGNIQILPGGNLQIPAGGIQVFRIQAAANGNGHRTTDVNENGKHTHIEEDQNGIEVKMTESVNGKEKTETFKAKDADELKKKSPEAHKLYEKYMKGQGLGNIQIQAQAIPLQIGGPLPRFAPVVPPRAGKSDAQKQAERDIEAAQKRIAEATEKLRGNAGGDAEQLKKALDQLDEARKELEAARGKLGGER